MIISKEQLKTRHHFTDYLYWNVLLALPVFTAGLAIYRQSILWLLVYVAFAGVTVALVLRFFCTRCPHYDREDRSLKCIFFWGLPKFFTPRPGTLSSTDMVLAFGPAVLLFLFPLFWLLLEPGLLVIYILGLIALATTMKRYECGRCIYHECPVNSVPESLRNEN
jgi:hypothetical protein